MGSNYGIDILWWPWPKCPPGVASSSVYNGAVSRYLALSTAFYYENTMILTAGLK